MKKRLLLIMMMLIVGLSSMIFVACGNVSPNNISLSVASGLENNTLNLIVGDEEKSSGDIVVKINNYSESISNVIHFSSDSSAISISEPTYIAGGSAKITVTAVHGGTAFITATTAQFDKKITFKVVVKEKIVDFSLKSSKEIYYERGSEGFVLNLEDYINFSPKTTTERELLVYNGAECLTENGITTIKNIEEDTFLTIVSPNLSEKSVSLRVKVVKSLRDESIEMLRSTYDNNKNQIYSQIASGETINLLRGNIAKVGTINSEEVQLKIAVKFDDKNLNICAKVYTKQNNEFVENKYQLAEKQSSSFAGGEHETIFKVQYSGETEMKIVISFEIYGYTYSITKEVFIKTLDAPSNVSINNETTRFAYTVYTTSEAYIGKKLTFKFFPENSISYKAYIYLDSNADNALFIKNAQGKIKDKETASGDFSKKVAIRSDETIYIAGNNVGSIGKNQTLVVRIEYVFDNINYYFDTEIDISIKKTPTDVKVLADGTLNGQSSLGQESVTNLALDINSTGTRLTGTGKSTNYDAKSYADLFVYAEVEGYLELGHDYYVINNSSVVEVVTSGDKVKILAKSVGIANVSFVFETGKRVNISINVISSVDKYDIVFPSNIQNSNVYSLTKSTNENCLFDIILLTGSKIYPTITTSGQLSEFAISCKDDSGLYEIVSYSNGCFTILEDTTSFRLCTISFQYSYINGTKIDTQDVTIQFQVKSISEISKYYLTTNKKGTSFSLYDYSRVGYYFQNLSTALITLNIEPEGLRSSFISSITWSTNVGELYKTSEQGSDVETYEHDYFMLSYDIKTGIATILCNVSKDVEYNGETISLTASFQRAITDDKTEKYERSVKFDIIQNKKIDEITSTLKEISIDKNNNNLVLYTSIFPEDASSSKLDIKFIPNDLKDQNAITLTAVGDKVSIKLNDGYTSGSGIIRIIAMDSYTSPSSFTTYLDIPLVICDGSVEYPYKITKTEDLEIIHTTNYEKCYQIVGQVELTDKYIETFSQNVFKGKLTGTNNAKLTNIKLNTVSDGAIGLFKEIAENAIVENITFEGDINAEKITPEKEINIGLIAGINNGTLENVFVILGQSKVSSSGSYKINIGGVVGQNNGTITASGTLVRFISALTFTDIGSHNSEHILLIGGVTGKNAGTISGGASNAATEINNASTTADVNIIVLSKITTKSDDGTESIATDVSKVTSENEGIGAIAGYSKGALTGLKAIGEICAGKFSICAGEFSNSTFDGHFNNVGGLVGYNSANIDGCISQIFVRGKTNVGGIVGIQKGGKLSLNKVQALEKTSRTGDNAALIIGNENVGGIAGQVDSQSGSVDKCTFISYISKTHNGDIIVYNANSTSVGRLVGNGGETKLSNCVAIADVNYTATTDANFKENNVIFGNVNGAASNYITNSSFLNGILSVSDNCGLSEFITALSNVAEANKEKVAYIILPPTEIKFELTENGKNQQLKTNSSEDQLMFYLFYHQKLNAEKQNEFDLKNCYSIAELIKITLNSNTSTKLTSSNTSVLKIDGSNFVVSGTGLVEITVTSEFNTSLNKKFYVFVTNYFSNFDMFLNADKTLNQITNNSAMSWDKNSSYMLYFNFLDKYNTEGYYNYSDLKVAIYLGDELLYAGKSLQFINFLNISFDAYQISFTSLQKTPVAIKILPYFEITVDGKTYSTLFTEKVDDENDVLKNNLNKEISFSLKVLNLTSKIESSETEVDVMPFYTPTFDINLTSENDDETITISILKFENGVYTLSEDLECSINSEKKSSLSLNAAEVKSFTVAFSLKDKFRKISKKTTYKIVISSTNGKTCEIIINYIPQKPDQVDMNLYPYIDTKDDRENYSYISSNKINPGASLLELLIVPSYSHYQYITIKNLPTNEYKIVFESLYSRETSKKIVGAIDIDGGIKIPKSVVDQLGGRFCIRIFLDYRITDLTTLGLEVEVVSDEAEVVKSFTKTLFVEHLPGVNISIDGVRETSNEQKHKLANGLKYDVDLNIKGFDFGSELQYNSTSGTYTLGEVTIIFSNPQLATLFRNSDGTFTLKVSSDTSINRFLTITAYGEKVTETGVKKSAEFKFYIEVVHFIVKESDNTKDSTLADIVSEISNNIRRGAVGDSFVLEISLNDDILIYDKSNKAIVAEVQAFLKNLTESGSWFATSNLGDSSPNYVKLTGSNDPETSAIKIKKVGNKFVVEFKQIDRSQSVLFKFAAKFDYTDGVPIVSDTGTYDLIQAGFSFEITERTSLTNPYPIKSADDFMKMVDGNYYILLDDITLPNDFEPITANIGGFDGNNKKIKFESNINIKNAGGDIVYNFGLFESISENTIISNLILEIGGVLTVDLSSYDSINFGLLASENNGTITNCSIVGRTTTSRIEVVGLDLTSVSSEPNNIIAAFVAKNYGSITNSRVEVSIEGKGNVAGFVYENNGTIASSYFYGTVANETTSTASKTGGFVGVNNFDGLIFTSYITGDYEDAYLNGTFKTPFATSSNKFVATKHRAGAFVYTNYGKISNCYANIPVSATATRASGFVYSNEASGSIEYCYSTSKMSNFNIGHTVFIGRSAEQLLNKGKLLECFAVEEVILSLGAKITDKDNKEYYSDSNMTFMNYKIGSNSEIEKDGEFVIIRNTYGEYNGYKLNIDGTDYNDGELKTIQQKFADPTTFEKFALSNDTDLVSGVWFMPTSRNLGAYTRNDGNVYINLTIGRPELVSPNLLVYGNKTENGTSYDTITEETTYLYSPAENEGSLHNPYVISNVEELELIAEQATEYNLGENKYYRLVNDIVYELGTTSSKLYRYNFLGNLEGNSFKISNYVIDSSDALDTAGFFASIGTSVKQMGSIKNVDFAPKYINLPNTNSVGAVAGSSYGSNIINVSVDGYENDYEGIVILGRNLVGGVVGYATGNYVFNNITVNISCNATYRAVLNKDDVVVELDKYNKQKVSEAGLVVGGATGYGKFSYIYVEGNNVSIGECAGLVFGYIDKNIVANNITVTSSIDQYVKADIYGGVIAGASNGKIVNANIIDEIGRDSFFAPTVYTPIAIGNIVGFMIGGEISAVNVLTNTRVRPEISYVGGAVGIMQGGKLDTILITGEIKAGAGVGGFVGFAGKVDANGYKSDVVYGALQNTITLKNLNLKGDISSVSSQSVVTVGKVIGVAKLTYTKGSSSSQGGVDQGSVDKDKITIENTTVESAISITNYSFEQNVEIWCDNFYVYTYIYNGEPERKNSSDDESKCEPSQIYAVINNYKLNGGQQKNEQ